MDNEVDGGAEADSEVDNRGAQAGTESKESSHGADNRSDEGGAAYLQLVSEQNAFEVDWRTLCRN